MRDDHVDRLKVYAQQCVQPKSTNSPIFCGEAWKSITTYTVVLDVFYRMFEVVEDFVLVI